MLGGIFQWLYSFVGSNETVYNEEIVKLLNEDPNVGVETMINQTPVTMMYLQDYVYLNFRKENETNDYLLTKDMFHNKFLKENKCTKMEVVRYEEDTTCSVLSYLHNYERQRAVNDYYPD